MPMQAMCSLGSETPMSALPSLVQTTKPPVSAMAKLTPVMPASAAMNLLAQMPARRFGQVVRIGGSLLGPQMLVKRLAHLLLLDVDGRQHDVAGRLVAQLHDPFAQVGVDHLDAVLLQIRIQVALFGQHRLALDDSLHLVLLQNLEHDLVVLLGVCRPMHVNPTLRGLLLKLLQVFGQPRQRVRFDLCSQLAQLLPTPAPLQPPLSRLARTNHNAWSCQCVRSSF